MSFVSLSHGHDDIIFDSFISNFYQYLNLNNNKRLGFSYLNSTHAEIPWLTQFPRSSSGNIEKVFTYDVIQTNESVRDALMQVPNSIFGRIFTLSTVLDVLDLNKSNQYSNSIARIQLVLPVCQDNFCVSVTSPKRVAYIALDIVGYDLGLRILNLHCPITNFTVNFPFSQWLDSMQECWFSIRSSHVHLFRVLLPVDSTTVVQKFNAIESYHTVTSVPTIKNTDNGFWSGQLNKLKIHSSV